MQIDFCSKDPPIEVWAKPPTSLHPKTIPVVTLEKHLT